MYSGRNCLLSNSYLFYSAVFLKPDKTPFKQGDTMYRHDLAETYEKLSLHTGTTAELYSGPFGQDMLADLQENGTNALLFHSSETSGPRQW